jgi:hypothetical protein
MRGGSRCSLPHKVRGIAGRKVGSAVGHPVAPCENLMAAPDGPPSVSPFRQCAASEKSNLGAGTSGLVVPQTPGVETMRSHLYGAIAIAAIIATPAMAQTTTPTSNTMSTPGPGAGTSQTLSHDGSASLTNSNASRASKSPGAGASPHTDFSGLPAARPTERRPPAPQVREAGSRQRRGNRSRLSKPAQCTATEGSGAGRGRRVNRAIRSGDRRRRAVTEERHRHPKGDHGPGEVALHV